MWNTWIQKMEQKMDGCCTGHALEEGPKALVMYYWSIRSPGFFCSKTQKYNSLECLGDDQAELRGVGVSNTSSVWNPPEKNLSPAPPWSPLTLIWSQFALTVTRSNSCLEVAWKKTCAFQFNLGPWFLASDIMLSIASTFHSAFPNKYFFREGGTVCVCIYA